MYTDLDYYDRLEIDSTNYDAIMSKIRHECNDYEQAKQVIKDAYLRTPAKKVMLSHIAEIQAKLRTFNAMPAQFAKLIPKIKKDITQVKTEQKMLSFYFRPIPAISYQVTTKTGQYIFTVPVECPLNFD